MPCPLASKGAGGTFHIEVNGVNKTGSFTVPDTGGWQNWVTIRKTGLTLSQGQQVLKLVMDSDGAAGAVGNFNYMRFNLEASSGGGPSSTPYGGAAAALPGKLQLEAFDNGGEGVAYHDLSVENLGGAYRSTGVDIETTTDSGGGYNIGWVYAGEWLAYTVNVGAAGTYDIEARVSSPGAGGTFHIEIDGVDRTGALSVPNTGGWQQWTTIRKAGVSLNAGLQVWRVVIDSNGSTNAMGNLNYLSVLSSSGSGTSNPPPPVTQPSSLSDRDIGDPQLAGSTTAANGRFTVTGSGQDIWDAFDQFHFAYQQLQGDMEVIARVDSLQGPDEWSKGGVMIRESLAATARNVLVAATIAKGWTFQRRIDEGGNTLPSDGLRPSGTAPGWVKLVRQGDVFTGYYSPDGSAWVRINSDTIPMSSTVYVGMAVTAHNDGERATAAFSNFVVQGVSASGNGNQPPTVWVSNPANGTSYTSPASLTINATASDNDGNIARVDFYASGTLIGSDTSNPYSFNWTGVGSGTYSLTAVARDDDGATTTSSAVGVTVLGTTTNIPTTLVFTPSADHITLVTSYSVALYRSGTSVTSTPVASKNLGKPSLVNNEISVSISDIVNPLPSGTYYAVVTAVGSGGSASSSPSASFTK
jgi:regulation of enolase protein 1 (concanavalin A-like superfamily)